MTITMALFCFCCVTPFNRMLEYACVVRAYTGCLDQVTETKKKKVDGNRRTGQAFRTAQLEIMLVAFRRVIYACKVQLVNTPIQ